MTSENYEYGFLAIEELNGRDCEIANCYSNPRKKIQKSALAPHPKYLKNSNSMKEYLPPIDKKVKFAEDTNFEKNGIFGQEGQTKYETAYNMCENIGSWEKSTQDTFVGDTGTSCHIVNSENGLFDTSPIDEGVNTMSGRMKATMKGKMIVELQQADGKTVERMLENVKVCPGTETQLFSITQEISRGAKIFNQGTKLGLKYPNGEEFIFDRKIKTKDGWIAGVDVKQTNKSMETINVEEIENDNESSGNSINVTEKR